MTFEYDEFADNLWVSISEPESPCVYSESETAGVILRVERKTGRIRGFEVTAWSRRLKAGDILIPELDDDCFRRDWLEATAQLAQPRVH